MTDKEKNIIQAVIRTLESLTLSGRENMSKVLGCIEALEDMLRPEGEHGGQTDQ